MTKIKASDNEMFIQLVILAFVAPLFGYIIGIIYTSKNEIIDRKLGSAMIWASLLASTFYALLALAAMQLIITFSR